MQARLRALAAVGGVQTVGTVDQDVGNPLLETRIALRLAGSDPTGFDPRQRSEQYGFGKRDRTFDGQPCRRQLFTLSTENEFLGRHERFRVGGARRQAELPGSFGRHWRRRPTPEHCVGAGANRFCGCPDRARRAAVSCRKESRLRSQDYPC